MVDVSMVADVGGLTQARNRGHKADVMQRHQRDKETDERETIEATSEILEDEGWGARPSHE